jgi:hypothetical protein
MFRREVEDRAALLHRLGYSRARARARLLANARWDFEIGASDGPTPAEIESLLDAVYKRGGPRSGPPAV